MPYKLACALLCLIIIILISGCSEEPITEPTDRSHLHEEQPAYLMAYFRSGPNQTDMTRMLHYAFSRDGLKWYELNNNEAVFTTTAGNGIIRDPFLSKGPDGYYHLVHTMNSKPGPNRGKELGYAKTKDLINFEDIRPIPVMANFDDTVNVWAPEWNWDVETDSYLVHWSSTRNAPLPSDDNRIYKAYTKDWQTITDAKLMFDPGYKIIDSNITFHNEKYYLFYKDGAHTPRRNKFAVSDTIGGGYVEMGEHITPNTTEAAEVLKLVGKSKWYLYYDYWAAGKYGVMESTDMIHWSDELPPHQTRFPYQSRHASFLNIEEDELVALINHYSRIGEYSMDPETGVLIAVKTFDNASLDRRISLRSLSLWVKPEQLEGTQIIYDEGKTGNGIAVKLEDGKVMGAVAGFGQNAVVEAKLEEADRWHHIVLAYEGLAQKLAGSVQLYINGELADSTEAAFNSIDASPWHIGERNGSDAFGDDGEGAPFNGLIQHAFIYNTLLQQEEVKYLYDHPSR